MPIIASLAGCIIPFLIGVVWGASRHIDAQTRHIVRSEERYCSLVNSAQDGIISIDSRGKIILFDRAAERIFGYSAEEVRGQSFTMLIPEWYRTKHQSGIGPPYPYGNLLALSKPREPEMKPISLNSLLDKVTELLFVSGLLKICTTVKEYSEDLPPVLGDEIPLEPDISSLLYHQRERYGVGYVHCQANS